MQDVRTIPGAVLDGMVNSPDTRQESIDEAGQPGGHAAAHSTIARPGWHVKARDLHPGDVVQQCDWPLHVREVTLSHAAVAVAVTEFEFPLHYAADAQVQLAA